MSKYFDKLDSLRGLAAFAVVLFHSPFYLSGNPNSFVANSSLFVDFFFILSGFVMTGAYQEKISQGFKLRDFFFLRLGRIYPLHFVILLCWGGYIFLKWILFTNQIEITDPLIKNTGESFLTNLLLIHSLNIHNYLGWNYPSWSISVEFFTYFVFFGFMVLFRRYQNPIFALAISIFAYGYILNLSDWQTLEFTAINGIFRCFGGFFAGVFLYQITQKKQKLTPQMTSILEIISICLIILVIPNASESQINLLLVIPTFALTVCVFSLESDGIFGKTLKLKPFANAGKYSYSIYLTHALVLDMAFSITKYLILEPNEPIFYIQTNWSYLINLGLIAGIYAISRFTYKTIEKVWIDKSKKLVGALNEYDKIQEKKSVFV